MKPLPHRYTVITAGGPEGEFVTHAEGRPALDVASPPEFGGSADVWSPEGLLTAAVATCFTLTFRSIAAASHSAWTSIECDVIGTLDRADGRVQFTHFEIRARVKVPSDSDASSVSRALDKAHRACLVANSLKAAIDLDKEIYSNAISAA